MRNLLFAILLFPSVFPFAAGHAYAADRVADIFAAEAAAVRRAGGIEVEFGLTQPDKAVTRGFARVIPQTDSAGARVDVRAGDLIAWSDGDVMEVQDPKTRTVWRARAHRGGRALLAQHIDTSIDAFISPTRFQETLVYGPKLGGSSRAGGQSCEIVTIDAPGGNGWRWHFARSDHFLRREEKFTTVAGKRKTTTIDYTRVRPLHGRVALQRPSVPRGFGVREFVLGLKPGDAPAWAITANGKTVSSKTLRGNVVVVDFWATWCGPCRPAMVSLQKLVNETKSKELVALGLRWQDSGDVAAYAKKHGIRYTLADAGSAAGVFHVDKTGMPVVFVIGRDGRVIDYAAGFDGARTESWLKRTVERALAER